MNLTILWNANFCSFYLIQIFDTERTGKIHKDELKIILVSLGKGMSEEDADELVLWALEEQIAMLVRIFNNV